MPISGFYYSTYDHDCPASITLKLSKDKTKLEISDLHLVHKNHDGSEVSINIVYKSSLFYLQLSKKMTTKNYNDTRVINHPYN